MTMKQFESGRSMVEMLGTLAIIGVLSIGGIAAYSYGMDKYRANQTMRDISLRTVDLITQASQGRDSLSLAEWDKETTIYDFANPAYVEGENLIAFDIGTTKKLPKSVCQMVFDGLANTAVQIDINAVHANSNETCGIDNTMTFYFAAGGSGTTGTGEAGEQCGDTVCGTCQKCDSASQTCIADKNETVCNANKNEGLCVDGKCVENACITNSHCQLDNQYCSCNGNCTTYDDLGNGIIGMCTELDFTPHIIDGHTYYSSNHPLVFWDAKRACETIANGLLEISDIVLIEGENITSRTYPLTALVTKLNIVLEQTGSIWTSPIDDISWGIKNNGQVLFPIRPDTPQGVICK